MQIIIAIIICSFLAGFLIRTLNIPGEIAIVIACIPLGIVYYYYSTKTSYEETIRFFKKIKSKKDIYVKSLVYIGTGFIVLSMILYAIYIANKYY